MLLCRYILQSYKKVANDCRVAHLSQQKQIWILEHAGCLQIEQLTRFSSQGKGKLCEMCMLNICSIEMETHFILLLFLGSFQVSLIFFGSFLSNFFIFPSLKFLLWTYSTQFCLHCPFSHQFLIKFECGLVSFWQQCKFWRKQGTTMWSTFFSESEHWALAFKDGHWCLHCPDQAEKAFQTLKSLEGFNKVFNKVYLTYWSSPIPQAPSFARFRWNH